MPDIPTDPFIPPIETPPDALDAASQWGDRLHELELLLSGGTSPVVLDPVNGGPAGIGAYPQELNEDGLGAINFTLWNGGTVDEEIPPALASRIIQLGLAVAATGASIAGSTWTGDSVGGFLIGVSNQLEYPDLRLYGVAVLTADDDVPDSLPLFRVHKYSEDGFTIHADGSVQFHAPENDGPSVGLRYVASGATHHLELFDGPIDTANGSGIILTSPDGNTQRIISIDNAGNLVLTAP